MNPKGNLWYRFIRVLAGVIFQGFGGFDAVGQENVPITGPLLVAPTHLSFLDPPLVACSMPMRSIGFMAKEELFVGLFGKLITSLGAFVVRRGANDTEAIRTAIQRLKDGKAVLIFPEGTRGDGEYLGAISPGIAMLAKNSDAMVLPVAIVGTEKVLPKGAKKPKRHRMKVVFGKTFTYAQVATGANERENRQLFVTHLSQAIIDASTQGGLPLKTAESKKAQISSGSPETPTSETSAV